VRHAIHLPNFADPGELIAIGVVAEEAGWDGVFLWDHLFGDPSFPVPMADPWVILGGLAARTHRIRLGTMVTPLARRRPQKVAREAVTVDHLSGGLGPYHPLVDIHSIARPSRERVRWDGQEREMTRTRNPV
jgi:alkanesulfonate monooxygenase SsuD/methylene tetrahydromethanopterin reductase-like flavin-dependent oxidoreductase (luciferase family)